MIRKSKAFARMEKCSHKMPMDDIILKPSNNGKPSLRKLPHGPLGIDRKSFPRFNKPFRNTTFYAFLLLKFRRSSPLVYSAFQYPYLYARFPLQRSDAFYPCPDESRSSLRRHELKWLHSNFGISTPF